jgi:hypothetical protein
MLRDREVARTGHAGDGRNGAGTEFALSIGMEVTMRPDRPRSLVHRAAACLLLVLLPLAGCSVLFVRGAPPEYHPRQGPPPCDYRSPLPGADFAGAVGGGLAALVIAVARTPLWYDCGDEDCSPPDVDYTASNRLAVLSLGLLASSIYGAIQKADCREAHDNYRVNLPGAEAHVSEDALLRMHHDRPMPISVPPYRARAAR